MCVSTLQWGVGELCDFMRFMYPIESRVIHEQAMELFAHPETDSNLGFERRHKEIIDRFDRYPHRNKVRYLFSFWRCSSIIRDVPRRCWAANRRKRSSIS